MTARTRRLLVQIGSFVLAAGLLYLALRGVDFAQLGTVLREADYRWLIPLAGAALLSHLLRAWRWQALLEALPGHRRVPLGTAFAATMIGYMVNYAAPRLGEVARSAHLASRAKVPLSGVIGTVVAERVLDVITLALALLSVLFLLLDRMPVLDRVFLTPAREAMGGRLPLLLVALGVAGMLAVAGWLLWQRVERSAEESLWQQRVAPVLGSFKDGMLTLLRARRRGVLVVSTLAMWFCYLLMAYIPLVMLGLTTPYDLGLADGWAVMVIGSLGVVVPSPGGVGSYHYITIQTLVHLFGVAEDPAAAYAVLTHAAQLVLYVLVGGLCLVVQGVRVKSLTQPSASSPDEAAPLAPGGDAVHPRR